VVRKSLEVPPAWQPQGLITLGVAADGGRDRPRKPLAAFVRYASDATADRTRSIPTGDDGFPAISSQHRSASGTLASSGH
jgi:hypothetical protein